MKLGLSFEITKCLKCSADRVLGTPCPECGKAGRVGELNSAVVNRASRVRLVDAAFPDGVLDESEASPVRSVARNELVRFLDDFVSGLEALANGKVSESGVANIVSALRRLEGLRTRSVAGELLRPQIAATRAMNRVLDRLATIWPAYSAALTAPTLREAQERGAAAQRIIEEAFKELDELQDMEEATHALQDPSMGDFIDRTLTTIGRLYPGVSLLELGSLGAREATQTTGTVVDMANGAQFLLLRAIGSVTFDPERLEQVMTDALQFCAASPNLPSIAAMPGSLAGLATSLRSVYEGFTAFEAVLHSNLSEDALVRRMIMLYGETFENVASPLFAWFALLSGAKSQPYEKLARLDATDLARSLARIDKVSEFFLGVNAHLRHAAQHGGSYVVESDAIVFTLRSWSGSLTRDELANEMLTLLESLVATSWALSTALKAAEIDVPDLPGSIAHDGSFRFARLWAAQHDFGLIEAREDAGAWHFTITDASQSRFAVACAIAMNRDARLERVTVRLPNPRSSVSVPLANLDAYMEVAETQADRPHDWIVALLQLRQSCRTEDGPVVTEAEVLYVVSVLGMHLLAGELDTIPRLRATKRVALEEGFVDALETIGRVFRTSRSEVADVRRTLVAGLNTTIQAGTSLGVPEADAVTCYR